MCVCVLDTVWAERRKNQGRSRVLSSGSGQTPVSAWPYSGELDGRRFQVREHRARGGSDWKRGCN